MFECRDKEKNSKRIIYIINSLRDKNCMIEDLASRFNVNKRTIYRDIEDIKKLFGENSIIKLPSGQYRLSKKGDLFNIAFNKEDLTILFTSLENYPVKNKHYRKLIQELIVKLQLVSDNALILKSKKYAKCIISSDKYKNFEFLTGVFNKISNALSRRRNIKIKYRALDNKIMNFIVTPLGWVCYKGFIYLVGFSAGQKHPGPFRLERIESVVISDKKFFTNKDFTVEDYIKNSFGISYGDIQEVKLLFDKDVARAITDTQRHITQKVAKLKNGKVLFEAKVAGIQDITPWILSFGKSVKVLHPSDLADKVKNTAKNILKKYSL